MQNKMSATKDDEGSFLRAANYICDTPGKFDEFNDGLKLRRELFGATGANNQFVWSTTDQLLVTQLMCPLPKIGKKVRSSFKMQIIVKHLL